MFILRIFLIKVVTLKFTEIHQKFTKIFKNLQLEIKGGYVVFFKSRLFKSNNRVSKQMYYNLFTEPTKKGE